MSYEQIAIDRNYSLAMHCEWILSSVSAKLYVLTWFALVMDLTFGLGKTNQDSQFTILLPAGKTECFFQTTAENWSMEIEYQVIAGSGLDVGFTLISPNGYKMVSDFRRSDGIHTVDLTEVGDYRLCFDNSFSKLAEKMVFFEVIISSQDKSHEVVEEWADVAAATQDSMVQYKLEDFRATVETIHWHLEKTQRVQTMLRAFEARDRYLLEDNLWRVSFWSCVNLLVILTVAVTQIYTLQRLFDSNKRVCT